MKHDWLIYIVSIVMLLLTASITLAETNTVSSTVVTNSTPPTANAPTIMNNNSDICKVGVGASVQNNVVGVATGVVIDDELCQKLKLSRSMYAYGMKVAAVSILCQDARVWDAMTDAGTPCPARGSIGTEAAQYWTDNPDEIPDGSKYKTEYVEANKPEPKEFTDAQNAALFKAMFIILTGIVLFSKADTCLLDVEGLCTPGVTIDEQVTVEKTEEDKGTEIIFTTTTTKTITTTTVTNEDSGNIVDEPDMNFDWGGEGPASMPSGTYCGDLGTDTCAEITGSGDTKSRMLVDGMGSTFYQEVDISDLNIDNGGEVTYSIKVDKQDAQDRIYMHVTGTGGGTTVFSGTDILSESGVSSGYQSYNGSFDFSGVLNKITIEIGGRDINLAVGPLFDDVSVNVFYNVISTIIEQQITTVEEIVYLNLTDPTQIDLIEEIIEYNDIKIDDAGKVEFIPIEPSKEEITYETVEVEIDVKIEDMEPEMKSMEEEIKAEIEIVEEPVEEIVVEAVDEESPVEEVKEETKEEPTAKEKAATKIVKEIDDKERYDDAAQTKTLIVMQILGDTKTFFDAQSTIVDTNVNKYLNKTIEDPYGILFSNAQDQLMNQMVESQYGGN